MEYPNEHTIYVSRLSTFLILSSGWIITLNKQLIAFDYNFCINDAWAALGLKLTRDLQRSSWLGVGVAIHYFHYKYSLKRFRNATEIVNNNSSSYGF